MNQYNENLVVEVFGADALESYDKHSSMLKEKEYLLTDIDDLRKKASDVFSIKLKIPDLIVAVSSGILIGLGNALFKNFIPKHGPLSHKHGTTRTAVDYGIPKPKGFKGSVKNLHRQIGPGHDIFRFKEALDLMSGKTTDFSLWGRKATEILGHPLKSGNMKLFDFLNSGGFNIPFDPKAELINHLLIDFFTKRSLPLPGSSYIADSSENMAKLMLNMYDEGLNLKNFVGNTLAFLLVQLINTGYIFLFWAIPQSNFTLIPFELQNFKNLFAKSKELKSTNEYDFMFVISHGASFLIDSIISLTSKNYTGLFQLNYASLLAFCKHLLGYLIRNVKKYREFMKEISEKTQLINNIDDAWFFDVSNEIDIITSSNEIVEFFNKEEQEFNSLMIRDYLNKLVDKHQLKMEYAKQLEGF
jgi:hypothetical protein